MRMAMLAFVVIATFSGSAQDGADPNMPVRPEGIWAGVGTKRPDHPPAATLSGSQRKAVLQAIHSHMKLDGLEQCDEEEPNGEWLEKITFETIAVTQRRQVILAESGIGCARGGQGANGAMWVVALDGPKPVLLATPQNGFDGWLYSVQPSQSHGYHDVVLGWHWSAFETGFSYFRFDGSSYQCIGGSRQIVDRDTGKERFETDAGCGTDH